MSTSFDIHTARAPQPARRRGHARADLGVAALLVFAFVVSGAFGIALATLLALALLAARTCWLAGAAIVRRVVRRQGVERPARPRGAARRRGPAPHQRAVRILTMAALATLALGSVSYVISVEAPSNSSLSIRSVEWLRDNGAGSIVSAAEGYFYTLTAPSKGGPGLKQLPVVGVDGGPWPRRLPAAAHVNQPADIRPAIQPPLPGEGAWHATQPGFPNGAAPVQVTTFRPDPSYPRVVAGVAWIDPHRTRLALYPGLKEPSGGGPRGSAQVPQASRSRLLSVFNSGFKHVDSHGGFFTSGHLFEPFVKGQGTIVATTGGQVDVRSWTGPARPGPGTAFARQNLPLIVSAGQANPTLSDGSKWGTTVGNAVLVWRSGLGVDRHGNLIYAAANYQSARSLARILIRAGAVRAVELDINSYWVSFNAFAKSGGRDPHKLLPDIGRPATRYLSPDDRDFFAVYAR
jgi:hypothetical protein